MSHRPAVLGFVASALVLVLVPEVAAAYVGPGAGLTAIGTVLALIGAVFLAIVGFIWYPVKRLLGRSTPNGAQEQNRDEWSGK